MSQAAAEHLQIAGHFGDLVRSASAQSWDNPAPVAGWTARDVVGHLVEWFPAFLLDSTGIVLPAGPSVSEDPVAAWTIQQEAVQAVLDDPETESRLLSNPHLGEMPLERAISQIYTADVFMHTWDLARATGQPVSLDEDRCAAMFSGMQQMDEVLRSSGQYGPKVEVGDDASAMDRLIGFIGRDPSWQLP